MEKIPSIVAMTLLGALCASGIAEAQVAGATTKTNLSVTESVHVAMGWSVKKTLMGKGVYKSGGRRQLPYGAPSFRSLSFGSVVCHRSLGLGLATVVGACLSNRAAAQTSPKTLRRRPTQASARQSGSVFPSAWTEMPLTFGLPRGGPPI